MNLSEYEALSFDCYGTLIDWEAGIADVLVPWAAEIGLPLSAEELLVAYSLQEATAERTHPSALYPEILSTAFRSTGTALGSPVSEEWAERLAHSVPQWPAFEDSESALRELAKNYRLIILSNVDRTSFAGSNERLGVAFDAIITAEDVGAYKPSPQHFRALDATLESLGIERTRLLHVAQSLFHDHVPAKREGLDSVWINRRHDRPGWGATPKPDAEWTYAAEFDSMRDFAAAALAAGN